MRRSTWIVGVCVVSVGLASLGGNCGEDQSPVYVIAVTDQACANEGQEIQIAVDGADQCTYQGTVTFTGGAQAPGALSNSTLRVVVPTGAKSGPIDISKLCPNMSPTAPAPALTTPCPADASPPDGGGTDAGSCTNDGTCGATEDCACNDCKSATRCGAGCTPVTVTDFNPMNANFVDGKIAQIDGPLPDNIQCFWKSGAGVGNEALTLPTMQAECGGGLKTCLQVVTENFSGKRYIQTSGNLNLTQTGPFKGTMTNVVLFPRVNLPDGGIAADMDGGCVYIQSAKIPTVDGG